MTKVTFNSLVIEVTHRCNLHCAHCLRGDAENTDISTDAIDALLDQTEAIYSLTLSGGEPCLNIDALEYIADGIEKRGIELFNLTMITNGTIFDPRVIKVMKHYWRIVKDSRHRRGLRYKMTAVSLGFSLDKYHEQQDVCKKNMDIYEKVRSNTYSILIKRCGNDPSPAGRAKNLKEAQGNPFADLIERVHKHRPERRIEVLSHNDSLFPLCPAYRSVHLYDKSQHMLLCNMAMLPDGSLVNTCGSDFESYKEWPRICNVTTASIWDAVSSYNENRLSCPEWVERYWPTKTESNERIRLTPLSDLIKAQYSTDYNKTYTEFSEKLFEKFKETHPLLSLMESDTPLGRKLQLRATAGLLMKELMQAAKQKAEESQPVDLAYQVEHHNYESYMPEGAMDYPDCVCCPY